MSSKLPNQPLAGVRVVDFSRVLSGPYCTALLADMGAEVIKIESPAGDDYRHVAPFKNGESALFTQVNRGKKVLLLICAHHKGKGPSGIWLRAPMRL